MPRPEREVKKERLNLDFHPDVKKQIQDLQVRMHADSMGEVVRRALAVYQLVIETQEAGGILILKPKIGPVREVFVV